LHDCEVEGDYDYAGFSPAKTVAKLHDKDELRANLPFGAATMSGALERGATIDLVYLAVGQRATTVHGVSRTRLKGACAVATHTVRTANVGASGLTTGTLGSVNAAVELLGRGGSVASSSAKSLERVNGELEACQAATDAATQPTQKCRALIQLMLSPIDGS